MQTVKKRWWYRLVPSILSVLMIVCSFGMAAPAAVYAVDDIEPPAWPAESELTADVCGSSVTLSWPAATDNVGVVCYEVYKNDGLIDTVTGATQRSCTVSGLDPSVYTFGVQAVDDAGNHSEALTADATVEAVALTVTGDGVETPMTFSMTDLQEMEQYQHLYSSINTWPTKKWYAGEGVKLTDLLASAGIKDEATLITVKATDGYRMTFTRQELVEDPRYYYPGLRENAEYDGSIPGSPEGAQQVETIIALRSAQSNSLANMNTSDALHLLMGQRWVTEQTNNAFVKHTGTIEVSTEAPEKWANPIADPPSGIVPAGTGVIFDPVNINDMDGANFHYTTDGSDPTFESPMYNWIKYRWWFNRPDDLPIINHPINVDKSMTIKAVAIGFGREDSDILTFNYQVPLLIDTGNPANATENEAYAGHTFIAAGGVEPYSFAVTEGTLPAGMELNGAILEGTPTASGTSVFTVTVTDSANPANTGSHEFTMVVDEAGAAPPALTADTSDNKVGQAIDITFTDDAAWRAAVGGIKVNDTDLNGEQYTLGEGNINIIADVFTAAGDYVITVQATGYVDAAVTQTVTVASSDPDDFYVYQGILVAYYGSGGDVIIPDNLDITGIGGSAFSNLTSLTSISIPEGVTSIDNSAFRDCSNLVSAVIPGTITSIGNGIFYDCSSLTSVTIFEGVTGIGEQMFRNCTSLASLTIPNSVTGIGENAFLDCSGLTSLTIPGSVTDIGEGAFRGCSGLTSLSIPGSVTSMGRYAFRDCTSLTSVTISEGVTDIGEDAFNGCSGLTSIAIPGSVTGIGESAFSGCSGLTSVTISEGVISIGEDAFSGCSGLTSVTIPGSVTSIGTSVFNVCTSLTTINVNPSNLNYTGDGGVLFNKLLTVLECYPAGKTGEYIVPDGVEAIGESAFSSCINLGSLVFPDSVTSIGEYAFRNCSGLTAVTIPGSVTSMGRYAFRGCSGLTSLTISEGVTSIGEYAFRDCSGLTAVTIPGTITSFEDDAFQDCTSLTSVTISEGVTSIGSGAFNGCTSLTTVTIPNSVISIQSNAFSGCSSLNSVTIPNSVTIIDTYAFYGCSNLSSFTIPEGVTGIGRATFSGCSSLNYVTIPESVTIIDRDAFKDCVSLTFINIPDNVTSIGRSAFQGCTGFSLVTIPGSVTSIDRDAFSGCSNLTSINIPESVTTIGSNVFSGCSSLTVYGYDGSYAQSYASDNSIPFEVISGAFAPVLTPDTSDNKVGQAIDITFTDDAAWRAAVGGIKVNDTDLNGEQYTLGEGNINIIADVFTAAGDYVITVQATGYTDAVVIQTVTVASSDPDDFVVNEGILSAYQGSGGDVIIPDNLGITGIGEAVFENLISLTSIIIPEGVTTIGASAFRGCSNLGSITIPAGVTSIGIGAIRDCSSLTSVTIPEGVEDIGSYAFRGSNLSSITIPGSVAGIGNSAFRECSNLSSVILSEGVSTMGTYVFSECTSLSSITIPGSVTSIGSRMFNGCSSLTSVTLSEGVEEIGTYVFWNCSSLSSISIPGSVTSIGNSAFGGCTGLISVIIPDSITSLGTSIFSGCSNLTEVTLPDNLTGLPNSLFKDCSSLITVNIPESVTSIGDSVFSGCSSLTSINIPDSVTSILGSAFYNCSSLTSINIPDNITDIAGYLFYNCTSLVSITIPDNVTGIGFYAFKNCTNLSSIIIPSSVSNIANDAFQECSSLTIYGYEGSYAQSYASANSIPFVAIDPVIWYVDDSGSADFTAIQAAVTAADAGDTIIVKDGTYTENVVVDKSLVIQSENGAELTIVRAAASNADVFKVTAENVTIDGFSITGATSMGKSGIAVFGSTSGSCTIINNQCSENNQGITIEALTTDNTVADNICTLSGRYGIYLSNTTGNIITGNTCSNNTASSGFALYLADNADNNTVNDNITDSNNIGIRVKNADSNLLFNNTSSNNNYGLEIATGSLDNVFYLNNFVGNTSSQLSLGYGAVAGNFWNSQTEQTYTFNETQYTGQVGNYWSDYTGTDADSNGIGDTPYGTFTNEYDNYPLMGQWENGVITVTEPTPVYSVLPVADDAYTIGTTPEGIKTMTVNEGKTGFKYFSVNITPEISHSGTETVVFTHLRNDGQIGLNATGADFDLVDTAQAGFNVQPGDVIKVFIVDELTNAVDHNPVILQ